MPQAVMQGMDRVTVAPLRLVGALAAGQVIGNNAVAKERVYVQGFASITVRIKGVVAGVPTVNLYPMLSDARGDDTKGARATTALPAAVNLVNATEALITYTLQGEGFVEVEVACGGAATFTVTYADIFLKTLA